MQLRAYLQPSLPEGKDGRPAPARDLTLLITHDRTVEELRLAAADHLVSSTFEVDLNDGSVADYPLDAYTTRLGVELLDGKSSLRLPARITVWEGALGYDLKTTSQPGADPDAVELTTSITRSGAFTLFALCAYGAMVVLGLLGEFPLPATLVAAALCGAMLGFAPFNRPVATIFLGDVGSLPIGLLLGWCLLQLAYHQQFAAALLLPMYYLLDATTTLLRRIVNREPFWAAHRSHFYQRATDNGFTVSQVVGEVFALNIGLAALAAGSIVAPSVTIKLACLAIGAIAAAALLRRFARPRA